MSERPTGVDAADAGHVSYLEPTLWQQLGEATTREAFCQAWLELQGRMVGQILVGIVFLGETEKDMTPTASVPRGRTDGTRLAPVVERAIAERKGVVTQGDPNPDSPGEACLNVAYPVLLDDVLCGVVALQIVARPQIQLQSAMRQLQWGTAWLRSWIQRERLKPGTHTDTRLADALDLAALTLQEQRFQAASMAFVTELATRLECDRVSLGLLARKQIRVFALSHSAEFGKQMNLMRSIGSAMEESCDQRAVLSFPRSADGQQILRAHEELARNHGDGAICTVPFTDQDERAYGALTLERAVDRPFDEETVALLDAVCALAGPVLHAKRRDDRLLLTKIGESLWTQVERLVGPRHAVRKLVAIVLLALTLFFVFAKGDYRVTAPTTLEGEVQRAIVAPYAGYINEAEVRAGDIVTEGQVMCTLDVRDLRLEYSKWSSQREQNLMEHRKAMAEGERAAVKIVGERMRQAEAQLSLLDEQIARAQIAAPFDGLVVTGDLSQSLGAPVEVGQVLFELAPLDRYRVMLDVDEREIQQVVVGQAGELILTAMPDTRLPFTVTKITPVSVAEEGSNYFLVEGQLAETSPRLRPGLEGYGKITVDRRKLIWIWTHQLFDWVRLKTWTWWP